jgi:hypothetical protein
VLLPSSTPATKAGLITPPLKKEAPKLLPEKLTRPSLQWLLLALRVGLAVAVALSMVFTGGAEAKKKHHRHHH